MTDPTGPADVFDLLKLASAYDNRKPSQLQAVVWAADLAEAGVSLADAAAALRKHYTDRPDVYAKPGHVITAAREIAADRRDAERSRAAIEAGAPREGALDPAYALGQIRQAVADARAAKAARESAVDARSPLTRGYRADRTGRDALNGFEGDVPLSRYRADFPTLIRACQNDRDHAGGDWCPGTQTVAAGHPEGGCDTCGARSGRYANTDPTCPRQDGWTPTGE